MVLKDWYGQVGKQIVRKSYQMQFKSYLFVSKCGFPKHKTNLITTFSIYKSFQKNINRDSNQSFSGINLNTFESKHLL